MKRTLALALLCALALALPCCEQAAAQVSELTAQPISLSDTQMTEQGAAVPNVYAALSQFGVDMLLGAREEVGEPALVSPLSVALALSMAANGAEGDTLAQFEAVLSGGAGLDALNAACQALTRLYEGLGGSTECSIANSLWVDPEGQCARTHYRVIRAAGERALVELELDTGRTHQIRVHLAHMGCPLTGDFLYGQEAPGAISRPALHSARLSLTHPVTGERLDFSCPLPMDMERLL